MLRIALLFILLGLAGCAQKVERVLPLCPQLALLSGGEQGSYINRWLAEAATREGIEVQQLSAFAASYKGTDMATSWLVKNYPTLICSFDPKNTHADAEKYTACMANAPTWIAIFEAGNAKGLFHPDTKYEGSCNVAGTL